MIKNKVGPDGHLWGDGPCIYGREHTFKKMESLDTGRKVIICPDCQKEYEPPKEQSE